MATQTWDQPIQQSRFKFRWIYVIAVLVALPVLFHLVVGILRSPLTDFYMTVDELGARSGTQQAVRVGGDVVPGSINWDNRSRTLSFDIYGQSKTLRVRYRGVAPDALKDEATAIVEGKLNSDGTFAASSVLMKCPHKYQAI